MIRPLTKRVAAFAHRNGKLWGAAGLVTYVRSDREPTYLGQRATLVSVGFGFTDFLVGGSLQHTWSTHPGGVGGMFLSHVFLVVRLGFFSLGVTLYLRAE